jgi:tetratricopeptide (TPR) repeat protein
MMNRRNVRLFMLSALLSGLIFSESPSWANSSYVPTEADANKYSLQQAMDFVQSGFSLCVRGVPWKVQVMPDNVQMSAPNGGFSIIQLRELHEIKLTFTDSTGGFLKPQVNSFLAISFSGHFFGVDGNLPGMTYASLTYTCDGLAEDWIKILGDALLRLKLEYDKSNNPNVMVQFKEEARRYYAMSPKPQLPEEARRFKVQAEAYVSSKRFMDAVENYERANVIAPWWPEGHFNRALILGEMQNFDSAMAEMKRYLILNPDAPDARQAQDKIYLWETYPFEKK